MKQKRGSRMKQEIKVIEGGITAAQGFEAAGVEAGVKYKNRKDMALIYSKVPCRTAGTFTTNVVKAAPVIWDKQIVETSEYSQAVVVNSGIANACTGSQGMDACRAEAAAAAFICGQAEQYRWNFLAYSGSEHPFSQPIIRYRVPKHLRQALDAIDTLVSSEKPLNYRFLNYQFKNLGQEEKNAVTDYMISRFNVIDYDAAFRYFGGYGNALTAIHATTGSDYEIKESFSGRDDRVYNKIAVLARKLTRIQDIHRIIALPVTERQELMKKVSEIVVAVPVEQIAKYFRIPFCP